MRTTKRLLIMVVVLALPLAMMATAMGAEKDCTDPKWMNHPSCPTQGTQGIEITLEQNLIWVHEAGDTIIYTIGVNNGSGEKVRVTVTDTLPDGTVVTILDETGVIIEAGEFVTFDPLYYSVKSTDIPPSEEIGYLVNTVTVTENGVAVATESVTVEATAYDVCDFDQQITSWSCIWKPDHPGDWTVSVVPLATRPTRVQITLRDHIPGNWCPTGVQGMWKPGGDPIQATFTIPDWTAPGIPVGEPVCPIGGAGGDFFNVGTPGSFYLVATGDVTVTPLTP